MSSQQAPAAATCPERKHSNEADSPATTIAWVFMITTSSCLA